MESFKELIYFEWLSYRRRWLFYLLCLIFLGAGFLFGAIANFSIPMVHRNSPYAISLLVGICSLGAILAATILAAQSLLRERDANFDAILYATPLSKVNFLLSRFIVLFSAVSICFLMFLASLFIGHQMPWLNIEELGPNRLWYYLQPVLIFTLPNILLCCSVLCLFGWSSQNKIVIYVGGLLIYVLYVAGSIFSNSPVIAGSNPASPEAVTIAARFDPFGLAALFEQTKYWSASDKNSELLQFKDNLLFNRLLWSVTSVLLLSSAIYFFQWRREPIVKIKKTKKEALQRNFAEYRALMPTENKISHFISTLFSFVRLDLTSTIKGTSFKLILIIWTFLLGIELFNTIDGGVRIPSLYPTTGLILNTILDTSPVFALLVIMFYSNELLHGSKTHRISELEDTTPYNVYALFIAKNFTLTILIALLIVASIIIGVVTQVLLDYPVFQLNLYVSLFYFLGFPLALCAVMAMSIQAPFKNKYVGLFVAAVIMLSFSSPLGKTLLGLNHPLLKFAPTLPGIFSDFNQFDSYTRSFIYQLIFALAAVVLLSAILVPHLGQSVQFSRKRFFVLLSSGLAFILTASFIFYETNLKYVYHTESEISDIRQSYEQNYRRYSYLNQPVISRVNFSVDLFPSENRYSVAGTYRLHNKGINPIDSLLIYLDDVVTLKSLSIPNAVQASHDAIHGCFWYSLSKPIQPGDSTTMKFEFDSSWSPFQRHLSFNSIVSNGSFISISDYFPAFGYQPGNEIKSHAERDKRNLPPPSEVASLEAPQKPNSDMVLFDATISTNADQIVVGIGQLNKTWKENGRNYFNYSSPNPIRFRFAFSSARYAVRQSEHMGVKIELFYHPDHTANVAHFLKYAKKTLTYCTQNFGHYPYPVIRFAEISKFAEGFAGTAYPTTIFLNEDYAFKSKVAAGGQPDVVNELAGHELSHEWWGADQIIPDGREGSRVLSETLAMYTELMLTKRMYGLDTTLRTVSTYRELYLSSRGSTQEKPLYKALPNQLHLVYGKGAMVMLQLSQIIGEDSINVALARLISKYSFPNNPPTTLNLLQEFYKVTPLEHHFQIDERFKEIITYDANLKQVTQRKSSDSTYIITLAAIISKYEEDGFGAKKNIIFSEPIEIEFYFENETRKLIKLNNGDRLDSTFTFTHKVSRVVLDPKLMLIDLQIENNERIPVEN